MLKIFILGIPELATIASTMRNKVVAQQLHNESKSPFDTIFTEEERIELVVRLLTKEFVTRSLSDETDGSDVGMGLLALKKNPELMNVIFEVVYPQFGFRQGRGNDKGATGVTEDGEGWNCLVQ
jgi:hypothetical protein